MVNTPIIVIIVRIIKAILVVAPVEMITVTDVLTATAMNTITAIAIIAVWVILRLLQCEEKHNKTRDRSLLLSILVVANSKHNSNGN